MDNQIYNDLIVLILKKRRDNNACNATVEQMALCTREKE